MIKNKADYLYYLEADRIALSKPKVSSFDLSYKFKNFLFPDVLWEFQKTLRKLEYLKNVPSGPLMKMVYFFVLKKYYRLSYKLGFTIPINVFGPGLSIAHYGTIIINTGAKIGANCRIHANVNIGTEAGHASLAPVLGDNVYIGPGAKIFGGISISNNVIIGANAVVNKSVIQENVAIGGIPAKIITENIVIDDVLIRATEILKMNVNADSLVGLPAKELNAFLKNNKGANS